MTPQRIAILADDLTGAADTAAGMLGAGRPWVTWRRTDGTVAWDDEDRVVAVDAGTRHVTASEAGNCIHELATRFRTAGFTRLYKKVDSIMRGHVGVEVRAALDGWHPGSLAVVAPAFPAQGRTTVGGRQRVSGAPLDALPLAEMLASAATPVTIVSLADVRSGVLDRIIAAAAAGSGGAIVCDAVTDNDLATIAAAGTVLADRVVWVGSGGLARLLFTRTPRGPEQAHVSVAVPSGPVLVVAGSLTAVTAVQASGVAAAGAIPATVSADALAGGGAMLERWFEEIEGHLCAGADVVITIERKRSAATADATVVDRLGRLLRPCGSLIGGVVATGGDTAAALLKYWDITGLRVVGEVEAGVPMAVAIGPRPLIVALKAGGFGSDGTLVAARAAVRSLLRCNPAS